MGCDQAVLINIEDDLEEPDQYSISQVLYHYMKDQEFDLILGGNVAIDGGSGQVAPRLAELLDIPCITTITKLEINGTDAEAERDVEGMLKNQNDTPIACHSSAGLKRTALSIASGNYEGQENRLKSLNLMILILTKRMLNQR